MTVAIHTIPVPVGWSAEQAWEAVSRGERPGPFEGECGWANVEVDGGEAVGDEWHGGRLVRWFPFEEDE